MNLEYTFIAIMFPAIPLTMVMFGNRFHTVSVLIRQMHDQYIYEKVLPIDVLMVPSMYHEKRTQFNYIIKCY